MTPEEDHSIENIIKETTKNIKVSREKSDKGQGEIDQKRETKDQDQEEGGMTRHKKQDVQDVHVMIVNK